ncbi:MAG: bifunctional folylpolyglutamate synthase/dihydrofolate synthase [Chloroflexi bacterium]|nr:bifunctional folylpolyglutamate synthase/dihydrofolate synthase [Chloroflexota bacterium]
MDTEQNYNLALDYLYSYIDYSLRQASEIARAEFNLDRMFALLNLLGNPHQAYPIIHVAGTKGKGSTSALCASALQAAGYKTGLYTSPHLLDYAERIQIDGQPISHQMLIDLVEEVKPFVAQVEKLTTFEITTALAFLAFAKQGCTAAVFEVGLGGRLDATNVVTPRVSVITSLSMDHMTVLGDTLAKIAGEKAGIIKDGVPVVSAPQKYEALEVLLRVANLKNTEVTLVGKDVTFEPVHHTLEGQIFALSGMTSEARNVVEGQGSEGRGDLITHPSTALPGGRSAQDEGLLITLPLLGGHQLVNAATAYAALKVSGLKIPDEAIQRGFAQVKWPARFEVVRREPPVIFDSAHNDDSFARLRETLETYFPGKKVYLIFGASEDKNIPGMFREMQPKIERLIVTRANHPRALEPGKIQGLADQAGVQSEAVTPVEAALARALELSEKDGSIVLSAGSMFVTAEVMAAWKKYY